MTEYKMFWFFLIIFIVASIIISLINNRVEQQFIEEENAPIEQDYVNEGLGLDAFSHTEEFHWDHMPITYNFTSCNDTFNGRMKEDIENAFLFISNRIENIITFEEFDGYNEADITFICDIGAIKTKNYRGHDSLFITEAEAVPYFYEGTNIYAPGEIYIYSTYECLGKRPTIIIHEILHLFGLDHKSPYKINDVMQPYVSDNCDLDIVQEDIDNLKNIYGKTID